MKTHNQTQPTVLVDMDGVKAHFLQGVDQRWVIAHPDKPVIPFATLTEHEPEVVYPEYREEIYAITSEPDFFHNLPVIDGAIEGIETLNEFYKGRVEICTKQSIHNLQCVPGKYAWIKKYLGTEWMRKTHFVRDKTLMRGTYLIDDKPHITGSMKPEWQHIRYAQPYNRGLEPRIVWSEVIEHGGDLEGLLETKQNSYRPSSYPCSSESHICT